MIGIDQNERLRNVAALARQCAPWADYAAYCEDRERGLRRQALAHLDRFLAAARTWTFDDRREFVDWLCLRLATGEHDGYGLIPHPLAAELVVPTLKEWAAHGTTDSSPYRWLGLYFSRTLYLSARAGDCPSTFSPYAYLQAALRVDPSDQLARIRLIEMAISGAEYSCHHLPHFYIGDPADDMATLAETAEHLAHVRDDAVKQRLRDEIDYVSRLIDDWMAFQAAAAADFGVWCAERRREYRWVRSYYY